VGGGIRNQLQENLFSVVYDETNRFISARLEREEGKAWFRPTCNFACWTSVFRSHGGFDERFFLGSDDREFIARLINAGEGVLHAPDIIVDHNHQFSLPSFLLHFFRLGRGSYLLHRVVAKEKGLSVKHLSAMEYLGLVWKVGRGHDFLESLKRTALVLASQASALAGYSSVFVLGAKDSRKPIVFLA
jgi:GT2 family glycosyltransferase